MIEAIACAKVNLSLRVTGVRADGLHELHGLFQSVSWVDYLTVAPDGEDSILSTAGAEVIDGRRNLAWRAIEAARRSSGAAEPVAVRLNKAIPVAAGLGGGSADAAAALGVAGRLFGNPQDELTELARALGADVPFCLVGGTADVSGAGELVEPRALSHGYTLGLVVPPVELATRDVFATWDALGGPGGPSAAQAGVPPGLRGDHALVNDLYPAAAQLAPVLDDWRQELADRWGRDVLMTGSGPTLFGFFIDEAEAESAVAAIPPGARGAAAVRPVEFGWAARRIDGDAWSSSLLSDSDALLVAELLENAADDGSRQR